ncbi:MAG: thiosulfate oxidation carrier protein SoxY [Gammaproteobacteria bacterium]|nr:thiosulfate oxidation carrier protein SoxY [Gammaproteobacteria bacterium]
MSIKRRTFIKGSAASGALLVATSIGLLTPAQVLAAWPQKAFTATNMQDALKALLDDTRMEVGNITVKLPETAEMGALVPITVTSTLEDIESISIFVAKNAQPLACSFDFKGDLQNYISTRIKMAQTSEVIVVVRADGDLYSATQTVNVINGGCGG